MRRKPLKHNPEPDQVLINVSNKTVKVIPKQTGKHKPGIFLHPKVLGLSKPNLIFNVIELLWWSIYFLNNFIWKNTSQVAMMILKTIVKVILKQEGSQCSVMWSVFLVLVKSLAANTSGGVPSEDAY